MKKYFSLEDFITFLNLLVHNETTKLFVESQEDGSVNEVNFLKRQFCRNIVILYDHPSGHIGIIQDTSVAPWDDYAEGVYDDLTMNDEYKLFIEA